MALRVVTLATGIVAALAAGRPCVAQQAARGSAASPTVADTARHVPLKSARTAVVLGILHPGLGQHYAGEHTRGFLIQAGTYAALGTAMVFDDHALRTIVLGCLPDRTSCATTERRASQDVAAMVGFGLVGAAIWVYGAADAASSAHRVNARQENGWSRRLVPSPAVGVTPTGAVYAGASLRMR